MRVKVVAGDCDIASSKPVQNTFAESFIGRLRVECSTKPCFARCHTHTPCSKRGALTRTLASGGLAERRYAACDPDNRLIAAQLEKNWETALRRVRDLEARRLGEKQPDIEVDPSAFTDLAEKPVGRVECAGHYDARSPAAAADFDRRHHRQRRR